MNINSTRENMQTEQIKALVIDALEDLKAQNITALDVRGRTSVTDWMIIANGTSARHVAAVAANVEEKAKHSGLQPLGDEGRSNTDWVLIDLRSEERRVGKEYRSR